MNYEILINNSSVWSGNIFVLALVVLILLGILATIVVYLWRKLEENEGLKYEFITIIAHKFRTPLTSIKWLMEGMLADELDAHKREGYSDIAQSTEKLISLTGTLIELTDTDRESKSSYSFEPVSICDMVQGVANSLRGQFKEKNISLASQCEDQNVRAKVDKVRLEFVLQTLLENARIYTPSGRQVQTSVSQKGNKVIIQVSDNGIGIDHADLTHIFSKFYRTAIAKSVDTEGFGVGLFLARSIVKRHRGKIQVYSEGLDKGTTFTITLPAVK